ncbi:phage head closure protein [Senegalia massiliensis]|uniref:phage head closure protein n=1 Tax=Senegalia massiliensis TaxID=1720316 RepID=UPI001030B360|nr:phage head closure protein [Senegalia massiliensis]
MYDHEVKLIDEEIIKDEIGQEVATFIERTILCKVKDIGGSEFYNAKVAGLKPEIKLIVHSFEYQGEQKVEFQGNKYNVIRTYKGDTVDNSSLSLSGEEIELTCEKVIGSG